MCFADDPARRRSRPVRCHLRLLAAGATTASWGRVRAEPPPLSSSCGPGGEPRHFELPVPGLHNAQQRGRGRGRGPGSLGDRPRARPAGARPLHGRGTPLRVPRRATAASPSSTTTPISPARCEPPRTPRSAVASKGSCASSSRTATRGSASCGRLRRRVRRGRPGRGDRHLPRRGDARPGVSASSCSTPSCGPTPARRRSTCRVATGVVAYLRETLRPGDCASPSAAGDLTNLADEVADGSSGPTARERRGPDRSGSPAIEAAGCSAPSRRDGPHRRAAPPIGSAGTAALFSEPGRPGRPRRVAGRGRRDRHRSRSWSGRGRTCSSPTRVRRCCACTLADGFAAIEIEADRAAPAGRPPTRCWPSEAAAGLTGLEWAVGIPGSVGGAVRMNAGGHGAETADVLVAAVVISSRRGRASSSNGRRWISPTGTRRSAPDEW